MCALCTGSCAALLPPLPPYTQRTHAAVPRLPPLHPFTPPPRPLHTLTLTPHSPLTNTGHSLLKKKADALNMRFRQILKRIVDTKEEMGRVMKASFFSLAQAKYATGEFKHTVFDSVDQVGVVWVCGCVAVGVWEGWSAGGTRWGDVERLSLPRCEVAAAPLCITHTALRTGHPIHCHALNS